jgi:hypothetical protein
VAGLLGVPGTAAAAPPPAAVRADRVILVVRHDGDGPVTVDTTRLAGPKLQGWWVDGCSGRTVDAGTVARGGAVRLDPPNTGNGVRHVWVLVIVDVTAVPLDTAVQRHLTAVDGVAADLPPCLR